MASTNSAYDHLLKFLIVGESPVSKTRIEKLFPTAVYNIDEKKIKLEICSTAVKEKFQGIGSSFYRGFHGIIVVYDYGDKESSEICKHWKKKINRYTEPNVSKLLVGNFSRCPSERFKTKAAQELANKQQITSVDLLGDDTDTYWELAFEKFVDDVYWRMLGYQK